MMNMESLAMQSPDFPSAIMLARLADVVVNNNVLYRLVQPTEQGTEVVSVNRMVNVVPFRRVYRFDRKEELNEFCNQLLKRPLVIQPVVHVGRGLGSGNLMCGLCYKDDKWVMLINQTHPKILGRLQIGLDVAKSAMARGQSCEIKFSFSKMVEQLYKESLTQKDQDSVNTVGLIKSYFRYSEWEYGDLIIRYHGYAARFGRGGGLRDMTTLEQTFEFEDLLEEEIAWKALGAERFLKPHMAPVDEGEIREILPAWTVNGVSPLENIGEEVPAANYSYSQAGRLYESFRKKKRRQRAEMGAAAEGGHPRPTVTDGIELKVDGHEDTEWQQQQADSRHTEARYDDRGDYSAGRYQHTMQQDQYPVDDGYYEGKGAKPKRPVQHDAHGHIYPEVKIESSKTHQQSFRPMPSPYSQANGPQRQTAANDYAHPTPGREEHDYTTMRDQTAMRDQFTRLRMQGSDRSSHSEAGSGVADSGICSDSDGHARENSYDKSYPKARKNGPAHPYAMDNPAFQDENSDVGDAMRKHKELIAKMMGGAQPQTADYTQQKPAYDDGAQQQRQMSPGYGRDYGDHVSRNGVISYGKNGMPPHSSQQRQQHFDYADKTNERYDQTNGYSPHGYSPSAHSPKMPVEESFI